jgi:hypothetical protein
MTGEHEVGDYWYGHVNWEWTWLVKTRTGTFTRHCKEDAAQSAQNAKTELAKHNRKQQMSFQRKIEEIAEDMFPYYEDLHDIAKEIAMWANDYAAMEMGRST